MIWVIFLINYDFCAGLKKSSFSLNPENPYSEKILLSPRSELPCGQLTSGFAKRVVDFILATIISPLQGSVRWWAFLWI
jgi:hypothetical protein